jgi:hypothetical protein
MSFLRSCSSLLIVVTSDEQARKDDAEVRNLLGSTFSSGDVPAWRITAGGMLGIPRIRRTHIPPIPAILPAARAAFAGRPIRFSSLRQLHMPFAVDIGIELNGFRRPATRLRRRRSLQPCHFVLLCHDDSPASTVQLMCRMPRRQIFMFTATLRRSLYDVKYSPKEHAHDRHQST